MPRHPVSKKPQSNYDRQQNQRFKQALLNGRRDSQAIQDGWNYSPAAKLHDSDLLYWLLFVHGHDAINGRPEVTANILKTWRVAEKVSDAKARGDWPLAPRRNHAVLPWFLAIYPEYLGAAVLANYKPPGFLRKLAGT